MSFRIFLGVPILYIFKNTNQLHINVHSIELLYYIHIYFSWDFSLWVQIVSLTIKRNLKEKKATPDIQ